MIRDQVVATFNIRRSFLLNEVALQYRMETGVNCFTCNKLCANIIFNQKSLLGTGDFSLANGNMVNLWDGR